MQKKELPSRPHLEQLKKQAKTFGGEPKTTAGRRGDPSSLFELRRDRLDGLICFAGSNPDGIQNEMVGATGFEPATS